MKILKIYGLFILVLGLITSCSTNSGSGGGSNSNGTGNGGTVPQTYTETDLEGTWRWSADSQTYPLNLTGTFTFNNNVRLVGMDTDRCPGPQDFYGAQFWMWPDGYVKGNNLLFCSIPGSEMKFSMYFVPESKKRTISWLIDIHQRDLDTNIDSYVRFDITLTKQ